MKKNYSAYKPIVYSDGISTWTEHFFDTTVPWTEHDYEAAEMYGPEWRITQLRAKLTELGDPAKIADPFIAVHAHSIRSTLEGFQLLESVYGKNRQLSREELLRLDEAEQAWQKIVILREVMPDASKGRKFKQKGRGPGPIRKAIARALSKDRTLKPRALWEIFAVKPPPGWMFYDTHATGPKGGIGRARFGNIVSDEKKKAKLKG